MDFIYQAFKVLSIAAFLFYGLSCLFSDGMAAEFERFGLRRFRRLTGGLEVLGALGLLGSYLFPPLVVAASGGLVLLMALGVMARVRVHDPLTANLPALFLLLVNLYLLVVGLRLPLGA